jgi:serine/threonine protein kinase
MGEVYEVAHARLSGRYAAKVLSNQIASTPEILSRFRREAQITSALRHPNIVQVIDFNWTSDGRPFLAMEYLEGVHLGRIIRTEGPLGLARVLQILAPIVSALGAVHRRAIIHRDLKPQNIMLVPGSEEASEVVKLVDFGLSKRTGVSPAESVLVSQQRVLLGTPLYMAPEQARGDSETISSAADQFSLGAITYEMLTRRAAFAGDSIPTVLYRIAHVEPEPMAHFAGGIPDTVERVVRRALSKDPLARYPSIGAFFEAFREAVAVPTRGNGDPMPEPVVVEATALRASEGDARPAAWQGRPARAAATMAGLVLALGLVVVLRRSPQGTRSPRPRELDSNAPSLTVSRPQPTVTARTPPPTTNEQPPAPIEARLGPARPAGPLSSLGKLKAWRRHGQGPKEVAAKPGPPAEPAGEPAHDGSDVHSVNPPSPVVPAPPNNVDPGPFKKL